jgi:hypothetical protein
VVAHRLHPQGSWTRPRQEVEEGRGQTWVIVQNFNIAYNIIIIIM